VTKKINKLAGLYQRFGMRGVNLYVKTWRGKKDIISFNYPEEFVQPIYLRSKATDLSVFMDVIYGGAYDFPFKVPPSTIVDCGANIGLTSVFFKNKFPSAKVIAIEPEKRNFEILSKNLHHYPDVILCNNAIWSRTTKLKIEDNGKGNWAFVVKEVDDNETGTIEAISLKDVMEQNHLAVIDILKIDIEGSEKELFESDCDYWLSRTKVIMIELHDRMKPGASKSFFKALCKYNFDTVVKGQNLFCFLSH
jgi:FkbM family methyltransferase